MLTKDDLKAIKEIVDKSIDNAIGDFAKDIFVPFTNYVDENFVKMRKDITEIKEDVGSLKRDREDVGRKVDALYSRGNRHDERIKRVEKKVGLPAFV